MKTRTQEADRKAPDKTPGNDLRKAQDFLRSARAKLIRAGDEAKALKVLEVITQIDSVKE